MGCIRLEHISESCTSLGSHLRFVKGNAHTLQKSQSLIEHQSLSDSQSYRYGYQGSEKDDEIKGEGNSYNYGARMHDPRVGRFLSLDAYAGNFAAYSPYSFAGNTPIRAIDNNGDSVLFYSESGVYLGYSHDNQRYKGKNLLVVIDNHAVENFKNQYEIKRDCTPYSSRNAEEANVAGLEGMGTTYNLTDIYSFYNKYKALTKDKNGDIVPENSKKGELPNDIEFGLYFHRFENPVVKGKMNFIGLDLSENAAIGYKDGLDFKDTGGLTDDVGDVHLHTSSLSLYPSKTNDWPRANKKAEINPKAFSVIVQGKSILFYRGADPSNGHESNQPVQFPEINSKSFKNAK